MDSGGSGFGGVGDGIGAAIECGFVEVRGAVG